jgi:hypothetical protein
MGNDWEITNDELEGMWEEAVITHFKILLYMRMEGLRKTTILQISRPLFEPRTS